MELPSLTFISMVNSVAWSLLRIEREIQKISSSRFQSVIPRGPDFGPVRPIFGSLCWATLADSFLERGCGLVGPGGGPHRTHCQRLRRVAFLLTGPLTSLHRWAAIVSFPTSSSRWHLRIVDGWMNERRGRCRNAELGREDELGRGTGSPLTVELTGPWRWIFPQLDWDLTRRGGAPSEAAKIHWRKHWTDSHPATSTWRSRRGVLG